MAENIFGSKDVTLYKKDALTTVSFRIICNKAEYDKEEFKEFKPDMAHQVFGESESIYGYRSLLIHLYYHHNSVRCFVNVKSSGQIENSDDIMESMKPWLQDYTTEEATFLKWLENEKHDQIFGNILGEFETANEDTSGSYKTNIKYKISLCDLQDDHFKEYHQRFQTFIVWFIDAANFIDTEDERWMIFYVYEEFQHSEDKLKYVSPIGFCSVYKFFAYPDKVRPRISQFFVLPTHQRKGIGAKFYHAILSYLRDMPEALDVTVEEPTDTFQRIRDIDDCLELKKKLAESNIKAVAGNQKNVLNVMNSLKLCKRQKSRLIDILECLEAAKSGNISYQRHLENIKNRFKDELERENRSTKRMCLLAMDDNIEIVDKTSLIDAAFKKYISDIEPSIRCLQKLTKNPSL